MAQVHPEMYLNVEDQVTSLSLYKNLIYVGTDKGQIQKWSLQSQTLLDKCKPFEDEKPILWMFVMEDKLLVHARFCKTLQILSLENLQMNHEIETEDSAVHFCKGDACQQFDSLWTLAVPIKDSNCQVMQYDSKKQCIQTSNTIQRDNSKEGMLGALKLTVDILFLGYENGNIVLVKISDLSVLSITNLTHSILSLDFDPIKNILISSNTEDYLLTHEIHAKTGQLTLIKKRTIPSKGISSVKIRKDGKILAAGSWDSTLRLFSWMKSNLKPLGALKYHEKAIEVVQVTSDLIAAGSSDGYVTIWNVYNT